MTHLETETDLRAWLAHLNLAERAEAFLAAGWRGEKLLALTREEMADLGVPKGLRGAVILAVADDPGMRNGYDPRPVVQRWPF